MPKGYVNNPKGRPKGSRNKFSGEIRDFIRQSVNWDALVKSIYKQATRGDIRAAKLLLEYGFGKPAEISSTVEEINHSAKIEEAWERIKKLERMPRNEMDEKTAPSPF